MRKELHPSIESLFDLPESTIKRISDQLTDIQVEALKLFDKEQRHEQLEQSAICRFGSINKIPLNFNKDESIYWNCGKRNECPFEGIICGFVRYEGKILTPLEVKMMQLISSELTNIQIVNVLKLKPSSYDLKKLHLYQKLEVSSKQAVARIALELKLINQWSQRKTIRELLIS